MSAVTYICDYCGRQKGDVRLLIGTPDPPFGVRAHICNECVAVSAALVEEELAKQQPGVPHEHE
jgi:ATP-dependent protease Clp ATPase subunit